MSVSIPLVNDQAGLEAALTRIHQASRADRLAPLSERRRRLDAVSYTHLDVYKRQP